MVRFLFFPSGVVTWLILGLLGYKTLEERRADSGRAGQSVMEQLSAAVGFDLPRTEQDTATPTPAELAEIKRQILVELENLSDSPTLPYETEAHHFDREDVKRVTEPGLLDVLLKSLPFRPKST